MDIVFLTSEAAHHYYLINEINRYHPVKKVFFQTMHVQRKPWTYKIKKLLYPRNYKLLLRGLFDRMLFGREKILEDQFEKEYLFKGRAPSLDVHIPFEKVKSFNTEETIAMVRKENADLIIVFGTEILKEAILKVARFNILNIHRGILPKYRGGGIPSWVFYHNDFENIGTTIHLCTEKLDGGDIVGQKFYRLQKDDKIYKLRSQTTLLAVEILKEAIDKIKSGTLEYRRQEYSKPWSSKELTIRKELIARRNFDRYIQSLK